MVHQAVSYRLYMALDTYNLSRGYKLVQKRPIADTWFFFLNNPYGYFPLAIMTLSPTLLMPPFANWTRTAGRWVRLMECLLARQDPAHRQQIQQHDTEQVGAGRWPLAARVLRAPGDVTNQCAWCESKSGDGRECTLGHARRRLASISSFECNQHG
jgi:hypothetical protein